MGAADDFTDSKEIDFMTPTRIEPKAASQEIPSLDKSAKRSKTRTAVGPALIATMLVAGIVGMTIWYLSQPVPILIQGEADATRVDIAARVDGRIATRPVNRGDLVPVGQILFTIENPELLAKLQEARANLDVARANLENIMVGTRAEVVAQRKAAMDGVASDVTLARQTFDRTKELAASGNTPLQHLDEVTNTLRVTQLNFEQAKSAYQQAVAGYTPQERAIAVATVASGEASVQTIQAQVDEMIVKAPVAGQIYQIGSEVGEYVAPGVPLLSIVDLNDVWLQFDLREDLVKRLKVGDQIRMRVPALGDRSITAVVKVIAARGEYAGWRATRATGDFDLRTFQVRAYPIAPIPELRPGMSVYAEAPGTGQ
jgi:HlyD family secretion protein